MPYNRKKSTRRKRRTPQNRGPTTKQLAVRIKKLEHTGELKCKHFNDASPATVSGLLLSLSGLAQGDDVDQRIGEEVTAKYLNMRLRFTKTASPNSSMYRVIVFWDKQTNGIGPYQLTSISSVDGLLDNSVVTNGIMAPHNYRTKNRYKILMDKTYTLNAQSSSMVPYLNIKRNFKLGGAKIKYSSSGGTYTSIPSRSLWYIILSDAQGLADAYQHTFQVWYTDA